ncbi:MAG: beta-ketoacyl synthase N-terminal-like domain-containing protein [Flavobacteriales bacterium]|nr:beta-ketoacyl synthase N-terminal-like domain-containing protein [Flavobacteriales bacterium]MDG1780346.1 beta-ketoacyl synthase N-terminal-like domain-containing protein [Flavobacteriales bacterium]MDG2246542.1 beta-ketoacyl synthase N-terminal-like domain-containing protein [Flavobacteriales bacterium]
MKIYINQIVFRIPGASNFEELRSLLEKGDTPFELEEGKWVGRLNAFETKFDIPAERKEFERLDPTAQLAVNLAKQLDEQPEALILGSARGATSTWEKEHAQFIQNKRIHLLTSPSTTLGNIAFNAARLAGFKTTSLSQSMTCSSGLNAVIDVVRRIKSDEVLRGVAGGVECPVTPFTIAQFESLKLLTEEGKPFPSRPLSAKTKNQLILSESGALVSISSVPSEIEIIGYGESWAKPVHGLSFATDAMKSSMSKALKMANTSNIDVVLAHAPGTVQGDDEEMKAIHEVLGKDVFVLPTKWITGHSLGASGNVSIVLAKHIFDEGVIQIPYAHNGERVKREVETILINATGFGGNAATVILRRRAY